MIQFDDMGLGWWTCKTDTGTHGQIIKYGPIYYARSDYPNGEQYKAKHFDALDDAQAFLTKADDELQTIIQIYNFA